MRHFLLILFLSPILLNAQSIKIDSANASIENNSVKVEFDLSNGSYSIVDLSDGTTMIQEAMFRLDASINIGSKAWGDPEEIITAEEILIDGSTALRVWYKPTKGYYLTRFLDLILEADAPSLRIAWGVKNDKVYGVRVQEANVIDRGVIFAGQKADEIKNLNGGAGGTANYVEDGWRRQCENSLMLTYIDNNSAKRRTIMVGGAKYAEFYRRIITAQRDIREDDLRAAITLSVRDSHGKYIPSGSIYRSNDDFYIDVVTQNPFTTLERYGHTLALANEANPNAYNFPTLCGWMASTRWLGGKEKINNSEALVRHMEIAKEAGLNRYTSMAVRLEPDYYCSGDYGNTQQGWWDDEHWAKYHTLVDPYPTFKSFCDAVKEHGGQVFTYIQASLPSNDFALKHPEWMLNDDISRLHVEHNFNDPIIKFDYTNSEFQQYLLSMWNRIRRDGVVGIKFDYPATAWNDDGGFDDDSYTTVSAYRKMYELCREGMGDDAYIHERILRHKEFYADIECTDVTAGIVDMQRIWPDASHFEPEMASRMGLRWYKQGSVMRYYPDGKSLYKKLPKGQFASEENPIEPLNKEDRRTFLTLIAALSGRIELGTSVAQMSDEMLSDLTKVFPTLPNGKSFRPVDFLVCERDPSVYLYDVDDEWKQVILINNDTERTQTISTSITGDQLKVSSLGLDPKKKYIVYDFWGAEPLGIYSGEETLSVELKRSEARIYAFKELRKAPQVIGTDQHIMCGMFSLFNERWSDESNELSFLAKIVAKETTNITLHIPDGYTLKGVQSLKLKSSLKRDGSYAVISLTNKTNEEINTVVTLKFTNVKYEE